MTPLPQLHLDDVLLSRRAKNIVQMLRPLAVPGLYSDAELRRAFYATVAQSVSGGVM
ncbi:hypothetical protein LCGC14_0736050 [marine sediment metagenome]|uniref:Uncharacterized protein n=1 Tax=marine sediment metagenome TaxID=412755 RepID=A0A0F9TFE3_9ZZZZ